MFVTVINCLRLSFSVANTVRRGYHGHSRYYQATLLVIVSNGLRLFVVVSKHLLLPCRC